jgi:outer membrane protein, multidrug efflux system
VRATARGLAMGVSIALFSGCNLMPRYDRPAPAIPASWPAGDAYLRAAEATLPRIDYRDIFQDPILRALIERALANNQDLKLAVANVAVARGQLRVQRAELLPRIDGSAGVTVGESAERSGGNGSDARRTSYELGVGLSSYEIDLFGRVRSLSESALEDYFATEAAVRSARVSLTAEVANAYLTLAADRSLLAIARETVNVAERSVELTRARLAGGIAPRSDLRQAETVLAQALSDVANLTTIVAQDRNALELLVGAPVADEQLPASIETVHDMLAEVPAGLDSGVLLRRPDVLQAEYQLRSANALIGAARAAFFPRISLTAVAGLASTALSGLFSSGAFAWSVQPSLLLPIFDAGANRGNLEATQALREVAVARYQKTIQTAFREVADALARRGTIASQIDAQTRLVAAATDNYALVNARYQGGVESYLGSLDALRTLYAARRSLATARLVEAANYVELYRALGGDTQADSTTAQQPA